MTHHAQPRHARLMGVVAVAVTAAAALAGPSSTGGLGLTKTGPAGGQSASSGGGRSSGSSAGRADGPFQGGGWTARLLGPGDSLTEDPVTDVSCGAPGYCTVGGATRDPVRPYDEDGQAFLVSEVGGVWQPARLVAGLAAVNKGKAAGVTSVSCASQGNCTAVGYYSPHAGSFDMAAFAVSEVRGAWQQATVLRGYSLASVSCASAGNCTAAGEDAGNLIAVNEINGTWQQATQIPGQDARPFQFGNPGPAEELSGGSEQVSCASPGNCTVDGSFGNDRSDGPALSFAASQINGIWQQGEAVPPIPNTAREHEFNAGYGDGGENDSDVLADAGVIDSLSCTSAGNCTATGEDNHGYAFVVNEISGIWQHPLYVLGLGAPIVPPKVVYKQKIALTVLGSDGLDGDTTSVSCSAPGNCTAGGHTGADNATASLAFVVSEVNGTWQQPMQIPGLDALAGPSRDGQTAITSVSCRAPGNCAATGTYGRELVFLATQINGTWQQAVPLPGQATAEASGGAQDPDGYGSPASVSCPASDPPAPSGALQCAGFANLGSHLGSNLVFSEATPSSG